MTKQKQALTRQLINVLVFIFTLVMNTLAVTLPLNGRSTEAISDALPSYFTPAGFTFSIWSVIYLALIGFVIYQALPSQRHNPDLERIGYLPAVANFLNGLWIVTWHYGYYILSIVVMLGLLASLLATYIQLQIGLPTADVRPRSWQDKLFILFPFSIYFAWINVATVANISSVAGTGYADWNGFGIAGPTWAVIMIVVVALIASSLLINRANAAYAAVLIWALVGINASQPETVGTAAILAAIVIALAAAVGWYRHWKQTQTLSKTTTGLV